jgi:2-polyprenyl-3-methyl-5-hydroxy-6-metoxy-1,4-benzoquinol methylase
MNEQYRVQQAYDKRNRAVDSARYSYFNKATLQICQQRERVFLQMLNYAFHGTVSGKRVLDIGCGKGGTLLPMLLYGLNPENCYGVDILQDRIEVAQQKYPNMHFQCCSAEECTFQKESFDLVMMFTCLSSILDESIREKVCRAAMNMLKPGGWVLIYDFIVNNPSNPDVQAVRLGELDGYFRGFKRYSKKLTLLPPLGRILGKYSYGLCSMCSWIPFLQTHRMTLFQKSL